MAVCLSKIKHRSSDKFLFGWSLLDMLEGSAHASASHNVEYASQKDKDSSDPSNHVVVGSAAEVVEYRGGHAN